VKRSPMKRGAPLKRSVKPITRKKRLAKRSRKTRDLYEREGGRRDVVAKILRERPVCEVCPRLAPHLKGSVSEDEDIIAAIAWDHAIRNCADRGSRSTEAHEVLRRSAGGSILDAANILATCWYGHRYLHAHPAIARAAGVLSSRYPSPQQIETDGREGA